MTVYMFDRWKQVRQIIPPGGLKKLIHDEGAYTLEAEITIDIPISPGEHLGFLCVDGRFRLFEVSNANENDAYHVWEIKATDAIVVELKGIIREDMQLIDLSLTDALRSLLPESWKIVGTAPDRLEKSGAYYATVWGMITTYEALYEWRIIPHYEFADGQITGRVIELMEDKPVFRGRILRSNQDAQRLYVKNSRRPITALYGLGPSQGTQDVQTNLTFADVEWSVANGDPVDKPKGQAWVGDPEAAAMYPEYTAVISITDAEDANDLLQRTWDELQVLKKPSVNVEAYVTDVQYEPGMSGKEIRIGDLVAVKAKSGQTVEAKIIDVNRDYIEEDLTEVKAGDKTETITRQVSDLIKSATHTFERLTVYQNRFVENENLIMLNADHIQLNADYIKQTADEIQLLAKEIELKASHEELTELGSEVTTVQIDLDALEKKIELLATAENVEEIRTTLNTVQIELDAAEADIALKASQEIVDEQGQRLTSAEANIDGLNGQIVLLATKDDVSGVISTLSNVQADLDAAEAAILLKADRTVTDGLSTRMNTAEADINAAEAAIALKASQSTVDEQGERISTVQADLDAAEAAILLKASQTDMDDVFLRLDAAEGTLTAQADTITAHGQLIQANADDIEANAQRITANADDIAANAKSIIAQAEELLLKATQDDLDAVSLRLDSAEDTIIAQAREIHLKADTTYVDNLVADYATIAELNAINAELSNLTGGLVTATVLSSNLFTGNELDVTYANVDALTHGGETVSQRNITMGDVSTVGKALSTGGVLDLQHSHAVTVNEDGTITFGGVATTGGSFRIADTKAYKDGVSAARAEGVSSVTLSGAGWDGGRYEVNASNGKSLAVELPPFSASGGDSFSAEHKTTVYFYTDSVSSPLKSMVVDASGVYSDGYDSGLEAGYADGYAKASPASVSRVATYDSAANAYNVTVAVKAADGTSDSFDLVAIDASAAYDAGYAAGYQAAKDAVELYSQITWSNPAQNYAMVRVYTNATVDGEEVASTTQTSSQNVSGYV